MNALAAEDHSGWKLQSFWRDTLSSVQFLSRLPVAAATKDEVPDFRRSSYTFPLAGFLIAIPAAVCLALAVVAGLPPVVAAVLSVLALVVTTGALHEDGLADVADGFWGGHTKERKLEIMRDSAIGTYGTLALVLTILLRVSLLSALVSLIDGIQTACLILAVACLSRLAMLMVWSSLKPARKTPDHNGASGTKGKTGESLSVKYGEPGKFIDVRSVLFALPAMFLIIWFVGVLPFLAAMVFWVVSIFLIMRLAEKHIGGHTGDVLGATQQISELGLYLGLVIAI